jgi:hypothetical protein
LRAELEPPHGLIMPGPGPARAAAAGRVSSQSGAC